MQDGERRRALVAGLEEEDLAALVCFAPEDVLLVSGYWPVMASSLAVLTRAGALYVLLPEDELELAHATCDANFIAYKPVTLDRISSVSEALRAPLSRLVERVPLGDDRVGLLLNGAASTQSYLSSHSFHCTILPLLQSVYPRVSPVDADSLLKRSKAVKTNAEIGSIRHLCQSAKIGFEAAEQAIAVGRREDEIAAAINRAYAVVAQDGFQRGHGYFFCMSGPNSTKAASAFARTRQRSVAAGDLVMIHANTVGDGLWTDITRSYTAGDADDLQQRMRMAIQEARSAALAAIRPGAQARTIDAAARDVLTRHGFGDDLKHAVGHGIGFAAADPRALPRLHPKSTDVLEAGMIFNIEPAIYIEGKGGMRHCDVVACTRDGAEVLTDFY